MTTAKPREKYGQHSRTHVQHRGWHHTLPCQLRARLPKFGVPQVVWIVSWEPDPVLQFSREPMYGHGSCIYKRLYICVFINIYPWVVHMKKSEEIPSPLHHRFSLFTCSTAFPSPL